MNRFVVPLIAFAALVAVLGVSIKNMPNKGVIASPLIGRAAPQFSLPDLMNAGQQTGTADVKGKWYLLNIWGTWCVECRHEHDALLQIKQSGVLPIVGLNWKDEDAMALQWLAQLGNPYDHVPVDHEGHTVINWGVYGAPETFLVNPQGIVVHKRVGAMTPEVWSKEFLPLMQDAASAVSQ
jgi:cytochrome c biogenesis protein CcmG, thiol:disulfide interchange protein DsbE